MRLSRRNILLIFLVVCLLMVFVPIRIPYSFESVAKILPVKEWHLKRGQDDSFISELNDNSTNVVSHMKNYKFERGDIAEVYLDEALDTGKYIKKGDTIAFIHSYYIENEITRLKNLKKVEENALRMNLSGEKQELIEQAENKYAFAQQQLDLERKKYDREKQLFRDSIISTADFEITENTYRLAKINVDIAHSELKSLRTGVKPEQIDYIKQQIESYSNEIGKLENQVEQYYITPPISGVLSFNKVVDGVVSVSDTTKYVLQIPVQVTNLKFIQSISAIRFSLPGYDERVSASLLDIEENVNVIPGEQMVIARALISGGKYRIYPGMMVQCKVICDKITILEYLKRGIQLNI